MPDQVPDVTSLERGQGGIRTGTLLPPKGTAESVRGRGRPQPQVTIYPQLQRRASGGGSTCPAMMAPTALQATQAFAWAVLLPAPFRPSTIRGSLRGDVIAKTWKALEAKSGIWRTSIPGRGHSECKRSGTGLGLLCWRNRVEATGGLLQSEEGRGKRGGQDMHGLGEDLGFYPSEVGPWRGPSQRRGRAFWTEWQGTQEETDQASNEDGAKPGRRQRGGSGWLPDPFGGKANKICHQVRRGKGLGVCETKLTVLK